MKRLILGSLSFLLLSTAIAPVIGAETQAINSPYSMISSDKELNAMVLQLTVPKLACSSGEWLVFPNC